MEITNNPPIIQAAAFNVELPDHLNPELDSCIVKTARIFWEVISYIIFPIILLRWLGDCIRNLLFFILIPGARINNSQKRIENQGEQLLKNHHGEQITLNLSDGTTLSGIFIKGLRHPEKAIICAFENGGQWEIGNDLVAILQLLFGTSILMINPRGVGKSTGVRSSLGYGLDTYAGYEFLQKGKKIDLENILLIGRSMGAAYGSLGASLIQEKYPDKKISMIHDRSFNHLTTEAGSLLSNQCCCCLGVFTSCFLSILGMEINSENAFEKLKGKKCVIYSTNDTTIPYETASLHKSLVDAGLHHFDTIALTPSVSEEINDHNRLFFDNENLAFIRIVENYLNLEKKPQYRQSLLDALKADRKKTDDRIRSFNDQHRLFFIQLASEDKKEESSV